MTSTLNRHLHIIAILCVLAVTIALISQHVFDMQPCSWCVFQRLVFLVIAAVCWLGVLIRQPKFAAAIAGLLGLSGVAAAIYQYTVAANSFSCDLTFADRFMVYSQLDALLPFVFGIYASCMDASIELLGIEYVFWSLGLFAVITAMAAYGLIRSSKAA